MICPAPAPPDGAQLPIMGPFKLSWDMPEGIALVHIQAPPANGDGPGIPS